MNAKQLVAIARHARQPYIGILSEDGCHRVALAFIASWLYSQDEGCRAKAATTACEAIAALNGAA